VHFVEIELLVLKKDQGIKENHLTSSIHDVGFQWLIFGGFLVGKISKDTTAF